MLEGSNQTSGGPPPALLRALHRLLRPLVRILLEHRIAYPALTSLLKSIYVREAEDGFTIPGKPQTISRLSLLTGIHRKDVKRLREQESDDGDVPVHVSLGAQLVLRWTAEAEYRVYRVGEILVPGFVDEEYEGTAREDDRPCFSLKK